MRSSEYQHDIKPRRHFSRHKSKTSKQQTTSYQELRYHTRPTYIPRTSPQSTTLHPHAHAHPPITTKPLPRRPHPSQTPLTRLLHAPHHLFNLLNPLPRANTRHLQKCCEILLAFPHKPQRSVQFDTRSFGLSLVRGARFGDQARTVGVQVAD